MENELLLMELQARIVNLENRLNLLSDNFHRFYNLYINEQKSLECENKKGWEL